MSTTENIQIQKQDPAIEAYRLGLLKDVQSLIQGQNLGPEILRLKNEGLTTDEIMDRIGSVKQSGVYGEEGYVPAQGPQAAFIDSVTDLLYLLQPIMV